MIISYTPPEGVAERGFNTGFHRGEAILVLNLGHGEYSIPKVDREVVRVETWCYYDLEDNGTRMPLWAQDINNTDVLRHDFEDVFGESGHDGEGWATIARLEGPVLELWRLFYEFSNTLDPEQDPADYTPGGDDDTYDYYPSAFDCMVAWAADLDELDGKLVAHVIKCSEQWKDGYHKDNAFRIRREFTARHRVEAIVRKLAAAKGPFEEWEFEDYAAPYITEEDKLVLKQASETLQAYVWRVDEANKELMRYGINTPAQGIHHVSEGIRLLAEKGNVPAQ